MARSRLRWLTISNGEQTATYSIGTLTDSTDEPDGSVTVALETGTGYTVAMEPGDSATIIVKDDDDPANQVGIYAVMADGTGTRETVMRGENIYLRVATTENLASDGTVDVRVTDRRTNRPLPEAVCPLGVPCSEEFSGSADDLCNIPVPITAGTNATVFTIQTSSTLTADDTLTFVLDGRPQQRASGYRKGAGGGYGARPQPETGHPASGGCQWY